MSTEVPYSVLWSYIQARSADGDSLAMADIYAKLGDILKVLSLDVVSDVLRFAPAMIPACGVVPAVRREDLWKLYARSANLSGYSLKAIRTATANLQPDAIGVIVMAWAKQTDLLQYNVKDIVAFAKTLTGLTQLAFAAEFNRQCEK